MATHRMTDILEERRLLPILATISTPFEDAVTER